MTVPTWTIVLPMLLVIAVAWVWCLHWLWERFVTPRVHRWIERRFP